jgi:hypothetical protein
MFFKLSGTVVGNTGSFYSDNKNLMDVVDAVLLY